MLVDHKLSPAQPTPPSLLSLPNTSHTQRSSPLHQPCVLFAFYQEQWTRRTTGFCIPIMRNFHLFLLFGAALQLVTHGAPITDEGVYHTQYQLCETSECTDEAKDISWYMKKDKNPCKEFEQFACGKVLDHAKPGDSYVNDILQSKADEIVYRFVNPEHPWTPKPDPKDQASVRNVQRMHTNYVACMNEAQQSKAGREPLKRELEKVIKAYPVPGSLLESKKAHGVTINKNGLTGQFLRDGWTTSINLSIGYNRATGDNKNGLSAITGQFLGNGLSSFFKVTVNQLADPDHYAMGVRPNSLGLSASTYNDSSKTQEYEQLIGKMFYILYEEIDPVTGKEPFVVKQRWNDVAKFVVEFEKKLAAFISGQFDNDDLRLQMESGMFTISEMDDLTQNSLDWKVILQNAYLNSVEPPEEIGAMDIQYLKDLGGLLKATDPKTIQYFFAWSMIRQLAEFLDVAHRRPFDDFYLGPVEDRDRRNAICLRNTLKLVPDIVSHFFVPVALPEPARAKAVEIISSIISTYSKSFQSYDWLKEDTRKGALLKLSKLGQIIGYSNSGPDNSNPSSIDKFYSGLSLDGQDHFGNQVRAKIFWAQVELGKVGKEFDRKHMKDSAPTNNASNLKSTNTIMFPAGHLQSPVLNVDFPEYLNYATFGMAAAHEITHAFDNEGINYDENGYHSAWFRSSFEEFTNRTQCLVRQFSKFTIDGPNNQTFALNGERTLNENIADNGAMSQAYKTWAERYRLDPQSTKYNNKRLPGLEEYTPEQMFFIQYARSWCGKPNPNDYERRLNDVHSPDNWRIVGVLQNSQDFAKAFNCQPGSLMNPLKIKDNDTKCDVW
ncbi:MAG: hypothetical protein J3Q66DRAFT_409749 [Benniella sp.]|nr:MAG: hypothetical protein J3Q66DRAFT_409749 [Benniella sp.]